MEAPTLTVAHAQDRNSGRDFAEAGMRHGRARGPALANGVGVGPCV